jgi:hypothetical protein
MLRRMKKEEGLGIEKKEKDVGGGGGGGGGGGQCIKYIFDLLHTSSDS